MHTAKTVNGKRAGWMGLALGTAMVLGVVSARGDTHTWKGGVGSWDDGAQWENGVPAAGGEAVIAKGTATLATASAALARFDLSGGQLTFSGADACVKADEVSITNGTVTHTANSATTTNEDGTWAVDGRVYFSCTNFALNAPGKIDVNGKGYQGRYDATGYGPGPGIGGSGNGGGGGGHGGYGSRGYTGGGGSANGDPYNPGPGSAGGGGSSSYHGTGGSGGGLVRIEANGTITVCGTITANGTVIPVSGGRAGGGSGGGIMLVCQVLAGTNGVVQANAGDGQANAGGGGGGRIALHFNPAAQAAAPKPGVSISAKRATIGYNSGFGDIGSISFPDTSSFNEEWMPHTGQVVIPDFTNWTVNVLTITNGWLRFPNLALPFPLVVSNNLAILGSEGRLQIYKPDLLCGGTLTLTNGASLILVPAATNTAGGGPDYGALVAVSSDMIVGPSCWVYPYSASQNGGSTLFRMANLEVAAGGGFNADSLGFMRGYRSASVNYPAYGPGKGSPGSLDGSGGGYGGRGGRSSSQTGRGAVYGDELQPIDPGSGGGAKNASSSTMQGGMGGGLVRIEAAGGVTLNGTLSANGQDGVSYGGGGSGGGIFVKCHRFSGEGTGRMLANGGDSWSNWLNGGGGGGRIAVWYGPWDSGEITPERRVDLGTQAPATFAGGASYLPGTGYMTDVESGTLHYVDVLKVYSNLGCLIGIR